jgi:hypothetical protein
MRKGNILDINGASPNKAICGVLSWHLQADTSVGVTLIMPGTVVPTYTSYLYQRTPNSCLARIQPRPEILALRIPLSASLPVEALRDNHAVESTGYYIRSNKRLASKEIGEETLRKYKHVEAGVGQDVPCRRRV